MLSQYLNRLFYGDSLRLLCGMPDCAVDATIADPMFGISPKPTVHTTYDWG